EGFAALMTVGSDVAGFDARVNDGVENVHHKIHDDHHGCQQHHAVAYHDQVAVRNRLEYQAPEARQVEHVLHHDGAGQQVGKLQPHDGDHRNHGVAQHMAPQRCAL